jgi:hypothetical protein
LLERRNHQCLSMRQATAPFFVFVFQFAQASLPAEFRQSEPRESLLVTGVKRAIALVEPVLAQPGEG